MFSKGADVDALRDSAGRMAGFGREVDVVRARGQRAVAAMQRAWEGKDLQHLVERWRRVEHDLSRISAELDGLSRRLHDNADLQHRSSGSAHAGGGHHGGGHPVAGPSGGSHGSHGGPVGTAWHAAGPAGGATGSHGSWVAAVEPHAQPLAGNGGRPELVAWGPDGGRPVVTPWVPQSWQAMGWGHWIGTHHAPAAQLLPVEGWVAHPVDAGVAAQAAHGLGLPIR